ncbi:hypothetical protein BH11PSE9_BH11PSE9_15610 [soil metagenome]
MITNTPSAYEALIQFLYQAPIGLVQTALDGEITMINPMSAQLLMPLARDGNLLNLFEVLREVAPQLRGLVEAAPAGPGTIVCESLRVSLPPSGRHDELPITLAIRLLRLDEATLMASVTDISSAVQQEQQRLTARLRDATRIDSLTAMPNRAVVLERIEAGLQLARHDPSHRFAVLLVNADRFTRMNVTLGQAAGDDLLRSMAARVNATVRLRDAVGRATPELQTTARLGGDEFVVVLDTLRGSEDALGVAQRMVDSLCAPYAIGGTSVHLSVSIGVVTHAHTATDPDSALQDASLAMREAKRSGGACYRVFEFAMKEQAWRRGSLESELRQALAQRQLFVVYQPIIELATGLVTGAEALVRWRHPERGIVSPIEFIEIAEETGLICPLGEFVLNEACREFAGWRRLMGAQAPQVLSVNLSRGQLVDAAIAGKVAQALAAHGLEAACLQLEVTESLAAQDQKIQSRLHDLKALGLMLALDDFGTGYSSLASLHLLPIDVVKIDRSFVSQSEASEHHRVLIEAPVRVARSLGMRTVAEGIETEGQAAILTALHCDKGQGYLYARPLPAEEATRWLLARVRSPSSSSANACVVEAVSASS